MAKQRKINNNIGDYEGVSGVSEHAALFLPDVDKGVKILEEHYESIYDYDILKPLILQANKEFEEFTKQKISGDALTKINSGLVAYIKSAGSNAMELKILKASILRAFGNDILTKKYDLSDDGTKQIIKSNYFEKIEEYLRIDDLNLIPVKDIKLYQKKAVELTKKYLGYYLSKLDPPEDLYDTIIYSGRGNTQYYKKAKKGIPDILSIYSGLQGADYFANKLLNSYTINYRLAQKFMVSQNNKRRAMVNVKLPAMFDDLFSSFFVFENFSDGQFELLMLPNRNFLYISERFNDDIMSDFVISENPQVF